MSKYTFMTDPKYGQGLTPEAADAEIQRIAGEKNINAFTLDKLDFNTAE